MLRLYACLGQEAAAIQDFKHRLLPPNVKYNMALHWRSTCSDANTTKATPQLQSLPAKEKRMQLKGANASLYVFVKLN